MKHRDFINFVKHKPYYAFQNGELVKFKRLANRYIQFWCLDEPNTFYTSNVADKYKMRNQQKFWLSEAEAMKLYPEYFI